MVNTREYEWSDVSVVLAGRPVTGLRGVKYSAKQEKELLHAKGNKPHSIQRGDASLDIVAAYGNPSAGDVMTTDILAGVEFTEDNTEWKQGDKFQEKTLPFLFIRLLSV